MINMDGAIQVVPICPRCKKLAAFGSTAGRTLFEPVNVTCGPCSGPNATEPEVVGRAPMFVMLETLAQIVAAQVKYIG